MTDRPRPRVVIVADDLIWATRLQTIARTAGAEATLAGSRDRFASAITEADAAVVDLALRTLDPFEAIATARLARLTIIAVGPHEDVAGRKRALAAGASRVYAYRKLFEDGPRTIAAWLSLPAPEAGTGPTEPATGRSKPIAAVGR